jgi:predicted dehydrogenase
MKIAIIGMGKAGRRYHEIASADGHQIIAYDTRAEFSSGLPLGEVMQAADAVVIATPPDSHVDMMAAALMFDLPMLVEKPLTDSENRWLLPGFEHKTKVIPVTTYRFHPTVWLARFENPGSADIRITYKDHIDNWRAETYERDADLEARIHFVDLLYWIGGADLAKEHRDRISLDFDIEGERECTLHMNGKPYELNPRFEPHVAQFRHFIGCVQGEEEPVCTLEDAIEILRIALT